MAIYIYNSEEIARIKDACLIAARMLDDLDRIIDIGISTLEIDKFVRDKIHKAGAVPAFLGYKGFPAAVCTSINEVVVHGIPKKKDKLNEGDIIGIDIGVLYNGYYGDTAKTYKIGNVPEETDLLLKVTKEALYAGIKNCVKGKRISDISNAIETYVTNYGFSPVREFVGHGLGRKLHEEPSIPNFGEKGRGPRILNGMVLAIEPMINTGTHEVELLEDGWTVVSRDRKFSAHFEHTVAVIDDNAVVLTKGKDFN